MSLRIKHLNADTSFLLIFSPPWTPHNPQGTFPGSFTILIDPWLAGSCSVYNAKIALTRHVVESCVDSIAELPDPDLVLISQDKSDHCHEETLTQLSPDTAATILGPAAAVKKIRSWNHFHPDAVQPLKNFNERKDDTVFRMPIAPLSPSSTAGEVTVSLLTGQRDLAGTHNALGITYRPPSSVLSLKTGSLIDLALTPPDTPSLSPRPTTPKLRPTTSYAFLPGHREKAVSVIYSPHGLPYKAVRPFATSHLLLESALPLTALLHSFDVCSNPWYMGGNICAGAPGGMEIARNLFPKVWISAHDEEKYNSGLVVKNTKTTKYRKEDIEYRLNGRLASNKRQSSTTILKLESGAEHFASAK